MAKREKKWKVELYSNTFTLSLIRRIARLLNEDDARKASKKRGKQ